MASPIGWPRKKGRWAMPYETFEIKFATRHVEFKLSREGSIDSLCREGFRETFQTRWLTCLLERWDHPDGRYKLVAYKGGGLYMCEDVNDPQWKEIIDLISGEDEPPIPLVSEDWFELEIISDHARADVGGTCVRQMSSDQIPTTFAEWEKFVRSYVVEHEKATFSLRNGRSGETVYSDTLRKKRDGSVSMVPRKRPERSR
jgi:hypothetical protein